LIFSKATSLAVAGHSGEREEARREKKEGVIVYFLRSATLTGVLSLQMGFLARLVGFFRSLCPVPAPTPVDEVADRPGRLTIYEFLKEEEACTLQAVKSAIRQ
jgi:hypothetical protein